MDDNKTVRMRADGVGERSFTPEHADAILRRQREKKITNGWKPVTSKKATNETTNSTGPKAD